MIEAYRVTPPEEGDHQLVTVASYGSAVEAEMARGFLEDHGIVAFAREAASFNPLLSLVAGGAFVEVSHQHEVRAREILARMERTPTDEDGDPDGNGEVRCPRCELSYCFHEAGLASVGGSALAIGPLLALLLVPFRLFGRKRWHCRKCLHVWDDPAEGPARMTPLRSSDPRPVFRLRRRRAGTGLALGLALGFLIVALLKPIGAPTPFAALALVAPFLGFWLGRSLYTDVCSAPTCRTPLPRGAVDCPLCRGAIAGVVRSAHEHYAEAAELRRELAALAADEAAEKAKARARPAKPSAVKKKRRAPPTTPAVTG